MASPAFDDLKVGDIMTTEVVAIAIDATPEQAAALLTSHEVSGAPVTQMGRVVGVVSLRDLVLAHDQNLRTVDDVMTRVAYAVKPTDRVTIAARLMLTEEIHRVVVVNELGEAVGMLSAIDVMRALIGDDHPVAVDFVDLRRFEPKR